MIHVLWLFMSLAIVLIGAVGGAILAFPFVDRKNIWYLVFLVAACVCLLFGLRDSLRARKVLAWLDPDIKVSP